ncbi:inositol 1,4,5-triphosphate receptor associated 2 isoform X3 [Anguilla rostrata]|uniref:inositol 1,4,5-triphosphate receptor associated 2 isoform X3 n=1 Tax=Anguilla rostrata TaxID=7938 RepID=UPI0030CBC0DC
MSGFILLSKPVIISIIIIITIIIITTIIIVIIIIIIIISDTLWSAAVHIPDSDLSLCPLQEPAACVMNDQPSAGEQKPGDYGSILGDSDDSGEELSAESVLESSWENLPMLERLGLSSMEMTEQEVEDSFVQLALAFRCDQYTLKRRLQAEEHDRSVAEENLHQELERTKDTLQSLKVRCQDRERTAVLEKLELSLENIGGTMEEIVTAAEQLGTVHQEARVTHAVELMVSHVQNLSRRHATESSELEETRRLVHRTRGRMYSDSTDDGDIRHCLIRQPSQQYLTRRRVSITLIPTMAQINDLESKLPETVTTIGDADSVGSEKAIGLPGSSKEILSKTCLPESREDSPPAQQLGLPTNSPQKEEDLDTNYIKRTLCVTGGSMWQQRKLRKWSRRKTRAWAQGATSSSVTPNKFPLNYLHP